jgi:hypothetical protein
VSARGRRLGADVAMVSWMALVSSPEHLFIASSSFTAGFPGSLSSRQDWNAAQSIRLKSGRSTTFSKDDRHVVLIRTGRLS